MSFLIWYVMSVSFELIPAVNHQKKLFIFGDHASKHIPEEFECLGLSGDDLTRHIAWDIGTETVIRRLCEFFGCGGQLAGVSRLVIDLNRELEAVDLIPEQSDGTIITGNQGLNIDEINLRINRYHRPYHQSLLEKLNSIGNPFVVSVHSFTEKPKSGEKRSTDVGLLVKHDVDTAEVFKAEFTRIAPQMSIAVNKPYSAHQYNHTMDANVASLNLRHLAIEIRQDHIDTESKAMSFADILAKQLEPVISGKVR